VLSEYFLNKVIYESRSTIALKEIVQKDTVTISREKSIEKNIQEECKPLLEVS
jgi:hypothetical protein